MSIRWKSSATILLLLTALILISGHPVAAGEYIPATLYSQPPDPSGGLYQSSWWSPNESNNDKYLWDNFTLTYAQDITGIQWRGGYDLNVFNGAGSVVDFEVAIYASNGAEPAYLSGPLVTYQTVGNAGETFAEAIGGIATYDYSFTFPVAFQAQGGTTYWVYIVAEQYGNPDWSLSQATGGDTRHFRVTHDGSVPEFRTGDLAFTLLGQDGMVCGIRSDPPNTAYNLSDISLTITNLGSNLDCISVTRLPVDHPNAIPGIDTGQYWDIKGLQNDRSTPAAIDFTFDISLPHKITPHSAAYVCKYPKNIGGISWGCGRTGSNANTVWLNGMTTGFSDWEVGNNMNPTALTLNDFSVSSTKVENQVLAILLFAACCTIALVWKIWRNRSFDLRDGKAAPQPGQRTWN